MGSQRICSIDGCGKKLFARGWCSAHWSRWRRNGDPLSGKTPNGAPGQFLREVALNFSKDDCLIWPFSRLKNGYAQVWIGHDKWLVSRYICEAEHGPPPTDSHHAAHSCGKGHEGCVNRRHISWKTPKANNADKVAHDTHNRGERQWHSRLTADQVLEIRRLIGTIEQKEIAEIYGLTKSAISAINRGISWSWLK